jgi:UDP-N-acetylmuramoylalanine--D-glutamate ligase
MGVDNLLKSLKENYSLASRICENVDAMRNNEIKEAFCQLKKREHELEEVAKIEGVSYINDSASTNINSLWFALNQMPNHGKKVILITKSTDNDLNYSIIDHETIKKIRIVVNLGKINEKLEEMLENSTELCEWIEYPLNMKKLIFCISNYAQPGDIVLFSPGSKNSDDSETFQERGKQFKEAVRSL